MAAIETVRRLGREGNPLMKTALITVSLVIGVPSSPGQGWLPHVSQNPSQREDNFKSGHQMCQR